MHCDYCQLPVPRRRHRAESAAPDDPVYCCYGCSLAARITQARGEEGRAAWMLTRLGLAVFLSMGVMVFSIYAYGQEIYSHDPSTASAASESLAGLMRYLSLIFATPVFFILGLPIFANAVTQWRQGVVSTDALVVVGVAAAYGYSYVSTLADWGDTYYETACMILVLVTLGRWLEASGRLKAAAAVRALEALVPSEITVRRDGETTTVRSEEVRPDDRLLIPAGQRIAVDGVIEAGRAHLDEQIVTGESTPVVRSPGDTVRAGSLNLDGALTIRATAVGSETTLGRLAKLLEAAKHSKGRYERLADRVAALFLPIVLALAAVAMVLGFNRGGGDQAILSALAVLLIACPCALGIATPMAVWVALGRAAAFGVLFRDGRAVEALARVKTICFDKTGTLTTGLPAVSTFVALGCVPKSLWHRRPGGVDTGETPVPQDSWDVLSGENGLDERRTLSLAAGLGAASDHAVSRSVVRFAERRGVRPAEVSDVRTIPGRGLLGTSAEGRAGLGSLALMQACSLRMDDTLAEASRSALSNGDGLVCVGAAGKVRGVFAFSETIRPEARRVIDRLKAIGLRVLVLTGDHAQRGRAVAEMLDVETRAELAPEDKVSLIGQTRERHGPVAMVGDGLNDAPALAAADVGIAMGCGADVTRESADICLLGNDLAMLPWLLTLAARTVRTIKVNLFWAFVYNVVGLSLALSGMLSPVFAAVAMVASSLLVVANSLRLGRIAPESAKS